MKGVLKIFVTIIFCAFFVCTASSQTITTIVGDSISAFSGDGGPAINARLTGSNGVVVDPTGNIFIADGSRIRKINTSGIINTIAGTGVCCDSGDGGPAINANLGAAGIAMDRLGNIFITNGNKVRKINTSGIISTIAGDGTTGFSGDGGLAINAQITASYGIDLDTVGNLYFSDYANTEIRKVNVHDTIMACAATYGYGIATDIPGNLYIAVPGSFFVYKVDTNGALSAFAGNGLSGYGGDGGLAVNARIEPIDVATDKMGNVYIADEGNRRIRKVNPSGIITTFAGNGTFGYLGDGGPATNAEFKDPRTVDTDTAGNVYISDGNRIRKVSGTNAIENLFEENNFAIYPNPSSGIFTLKISGFLTGLIQIDNVLGECIYRQICSSQNHNIDLSVEPNGVYSISFLGKDRCLTKKIIINR